MTKEQAIEKVSKLFQLSSSSNENKYARYAVVIATNAFWFPNMLALEMFISSTQERNLPVFLDGVFEWTIPLLDCQKAQIAWIYKQETESFPKQEWLDQPQFKGNVK